jgi:hypothetical protein
MITQQASSLISEAARAQLRILLAPRALIKGNGDYEIGFEAAKRQILESLQSFSGGSL